MDLVGIRDQYRSCTYIILVEGVYVSTVVALPVPVVFSVLFVLLLVLQLKLNHLVTVLNSRICMYRSLMLRVAVAFKTPFRFQKLKI
jgi:hypothetical protein